MGVHVEDRKGGTTGREKWLELLKKKCDVCLQALCFLVTNRSGRDCKKSYDPGGNRMQWASFELLGGALFNGEEAGEPDAKGHPIWGGSSRQASGSKNTM